MKVKPYRRCDICKEDYEKTHGCMKIKWFFDPYGLVSEMDLCPVMERMDVCPKCSEKMIKWIRAQREEGEE